MRAYNNCSETRLAPTKTLPLRPDKKHAHAFASPRGRRRKTGSSCTEILSDSSNFHYNRESRSEPGGCLTNRYSLDHVLAVLEFGQSRSSDFPVAGSGSVVCRGLRARQSSLPAPQVKGERVKVKRVTADFHRQDLTGRSPRRPERPPGRPRPRSAARRFPAVLRQEPPRVTRSEPVGDSQALPSVGAPLYE